MLDDLKKDASLRMDKCVTVFRDQLKKMRTGRAHTSLIEHIKVDYYGSEMPLNQVANIATEDARTLTVTPWEKAMVPIIEKAIYKSDLGLTPNTAGQLIRINMPALTEERRRDITKVVRSEAENARVSVRNVRREVMTELKEMLKEKMISQDEATTFKVNVKLVLVRVVARDLKGNAIGGLKKEPIVLTDSEGNDTIAIRSMQHICLGFDHRTIDGADAGKFMAELKTTLENWNQPIG